jgi:citrate lyase subunit beta/citryl-CoA lyase
VEVINRAYVPSPEEVEHAQRIIEAFVAISQAGTVGMDGKMHDLPHLKQAERTVRLSKEA